MIHELYQWLVEHDPLLQFGNSGFMRYVYNEGFSHDMVNFMVNKDTPQLDVLRFHDRMSWWLKYLWRGET